MVVDIDGNASVIVFVVELLAFVTSLSCMILNIFKYRKRNIVWNLVDLTMLVVHVVYILLATAAAIKSNFHDVGYVVASRFLKMLSALFCLVSNLRHCKSTDLLILVYLLFSISDFLRCFGKTRDWIVLLHKILTAMMASVSLSGLYLLSLSRRYYCRRNEECFLERLSSASGNKVMRLCDTSSALEDTEKHTHRKTCQYHKQFQSITKNLFMKNANSKRPKESFSTVDVLYILFLTTFRDFLWELLFLLCRNICFYSRLPILVIIISNFASDFDVFNSAFAAGILCLLLGFEICFQQLADSHVIILEQKVISSMCMEVYKKMFVTHEIGKDTMFEAVTYYSSLCPLIDQMVKSTCESVAGVLALPLGCFLIYGSLGAYGLSCLIPFIATIICITTFFFTWLNLNESINEMSRNRIKFMSEIIQGILSVKLNAWEWIFLHRVNEMRRIEVRACYGVILKHVITSSIVSFCSTNILLLLPVFIVSIAHKQVHLSKEQLLYSYYTVFAMRCLLNHYFSACFFGSFFVPVVRAIRNSVFGDISQEDLSERPDDNEFVYRNVTLSYERDSQVIIAHASFSFPAGLLVAVTGASGSGKSLLLKSATGQAEFLAGDIKCPFSIAYVPETPWIQKASIRDNILFGESFQENWYKTVLEACCLHSDIENLPDADLTVIADDDVIISDCLKQRINIARAVYRKAKLYLLDEPFKLVDNRYSVDIFNNVLGKTGLLRHNIRLLATSCSGFLAESDKILLLRDGNVYSVYYDDELFNVLLDEEVDTKPKYDSLKRFGQGFSKNEQMVDVNSAVITKGELGRYYREIGRKKVTVIVAFCVFLIILETLVLYLLNCMSDEDVVEGEIWLLKNWKVFLFILFIILEIVFVVIKGILLSQCSYNFSAYVNISMVASLLHSTLTFFESTPLETTLMRFSTDHYLTDRIHVTNLEMLSSSALLILSKIIFICICSPPLLIVLIFYFLYVNYVSKRAGRVSSCIKVLKESRLYSIFCHNSETIQGIETISAYGMTKKFYKIMSLHLDKFNSGLKLSGHLLWWAYSRLFITAIIFIVLYFTTAFLFNIYTSLIDNPTMMLLSVTLLLQSLPDIALNYGLLSRTFISIKRCFQYCDLRHENVSNKEVYHIKSKWPVRGRIRFKDVYVKTGNENEFTLSNLCLTINANEKIAVVGKPGAGKSAFLASLLRFVELSSGRIDIDGVDIETVPLHRLRSVVTFIPKDAFFFSGTVRYNLDPENLYDDNELWEVLIKVHLKDFLVYSGEGLSYVLAYGGKNLTLRQRQLLCIARAILRQPKILLLDESAAILDRRSAQEVEGIVRNGFDNCTVIAATSKIASILDFDKVIVLSHGAVAEFDSIAKLLADSRSLFYRMVLLDGADQSQV